MKIPIQELNAKRVPRVLCRVVHRGDHPLERLLLLLHLRVHWPGERHLGLRRAQQAKSARVCSFISSFLKYCYGFRYKKFKLLVYTIKTIGLFDQLNVCLIK